MGINSKLLKTWIQSKPAAVDNAVLLQMMKVLINALEENEKDIAQLQAQVDALSAAVAVLENQRAAINGRMAALEADVAILKG